MTLKTRSVRGEAKRKEIMEAAQKILHARGYHGTSMQDIAEEVGLVKASLYQHITNKEDIVCEIMFDGLKSATDDLAASCSEGATFTDKLGLAIHQHIRHTVHHTDLLAVLLENTKHLSQVRRARVIAEQRKYEKVLTDILEGGVRSGEFRTLEVRLVAFAILGMCNWVYRWYEDQGGKSQEEIAEIFYRLLVPGLKSSQDGPGRGTDESNLAGHH